MRESLVTLEQQKKMRKKKEKINHQWRKQLLVIDSVVKTHWAGKDK